MTPYQRAWNWLAENCEDPKAREELVHSLKVAFEAAGAEGRAARAERDRYKAALESVATTEGIPGASEWYRLREKARAALTPPDGGAP